MITIDQAHEVYQEVIHDVFGIRNMQFIPLKIYEDFIDEDPLSNSSVESLKKYFYLGRDSVMDAIGHEWFDFWIYEFDGEENLNSPITRTDHDSIYRAIAGFVIGRVPSKIEIDHSWDRLQELDGKTCTHQSHRKSLYLGFMKLKDEKFEPPSPPSKMFLDHFGGESLNNN